MLLELCLNHVKCEGPNAVKKEIKVVEVTQRTFSGTAQWVRFLVIFKSTSYFIGISFAPTNIFGHKLKTDFQLLVK